MYHESRVLEPATHSLLKTLGQVLAAEKFFLVGGTALAIQIGHRKSIDLDFFTQEAFDEDSLLERIKNRLGTGSQIEVVGRANQTLNVIVDSVKVDLLRYSYPLLQPVVVQPDYTMLAKEDIVAMKLSAITNRGSQKDFYDLYFLLDDFELKEMLEFYRGKFQGHDPFFVLRSLVYFDDADSEPSPMLLSPLDWDTVKARIISCVKKIA